MKYYAIIILILLNCLVTHAQTCPNFTDLYSPNVIAFTGNTSNPFITQGVVTGRHTLITQQGTDPNTGGALHLLPTGETQVIKLGNEQVGAQAEALRYTFTVDKDNTVLLLKFAVVLEDPNHPTIVQPRFVVRVTDADGNLTETCAEYDVSAGAGIPGFQTYQKTSYQTIRWRDWTDVGLDLSKHAGHEVRLEFITYDCDFGAHFGYAYFTASCMSNLLTVANCSGTSVTLSAPPNFESYLWSNGATTQSTTFTGITGPIWCTVTSATGCQFTLSGYITTDPITTPLFIAATICEGEGYHENYFNLPPQTPGVHKYYHTFINPVTCTTQTTELTLTVIECYNHIKAAICHGENYTLNGFTIIQPAVGVRRDTVWTGQTQGCDTYNVLELTVNFSFNMPNVIEGDASPCTFELVTYTFAGAAMLTYFEWEFPNNVVVVKGKYSPQVTLYFTDDTPGEIILHGENGCGSGSKSLLVQPKPSYNITYPETVCQGNVFNKWGFNLGVQDSAGYFVYEKHLTSSLGCDSSVLLTLQVLPTPVVRIEPKDVVICNVGDPISLFAITGNETWENPINGNVWTLFFYNDCNLSYLWNTGDITNSITQNPTATTLYTVTVTSSGCSATASQLVIVDPSVPVVVYDTICAGETYTNYGFNATTNGDYSTTLINEDCEVELIVHLFVHPPYSRKITGSVCAGEYFTQHGFHIALYQTGMFRDTLHFISHTGCDSTVMLEITVYPADGFTLRDTVCQYQPYKKNEFHLPMQNIAGEFTHTRTEKTAHQCDSIITLRLTVNPVTTNIISDEIEVGEAYNKYNFNLPPITTEKDTTAYQYLASSQECDSTVVLNLRVVCPPPTDSVASVTICAGETLNFFGTLLTAGGTYTDTLKSIYQCDSIVATLTLTVTPFMTKNILEEACENIGYDFYGITYYTTGIYNKLIPSTTGGCDTTVTLDLTVHLIDTTHTTETFCAGDSVNFFGDFIKVAGVYYHTLQSTITNCDSVIELTLSVNSLITKNILEEACENIGYNFYGTTYYTTGIYNKLIPSTTGGCDTTVTLDLTVHLIDTTHTSETICAGDSVNFFGNFVKVAGTYYHTQQSPITNCDSVIELTLSVNNCDNNWIIFATAGNNGTIDPAGVIIVTEGADTTFIFTPDVGYHIETVLVDYVNDPSAVATGSYTFENVTENHTIHVTFTINTYTITVSSGPNGSINPAVDQSINYGADQSFTFTPDAYCNIDSVFVDGVNDPVAVANGTYTFANVTEDHSIHVTFVCDSKNYTITATAGERGTIYPADEIIVAGGADTTFIFTPDTCYEIDKVWVDGILNFEAAANGAYTFENVREDHTISVSFKIKPPIIITASSEGCCTIFPNGEIETPCGSGKMFIFMVADPRCEIVQVLIDGINDTIAVANGYYTFENITEEHTIHVVCAEKTDTIFNVSIKVNEPDYGYATGAGDYEPYSTVQVEAIENSCYRFKNWTTENGELLSTEKLYPFTITSDTTLVANFHALDFDTYCLTLWDNTFLLNLQNLKDSGYHVYNYEIIGTNVFGCKWFKGETEIDPTKLNTGDEFSYSAGRDGTCLELSTPYRFQINTKNFGCLWSSPKILTKYDFPCIPPAKLVVYPNPISPGIPFIIEGVGKNTPINVYNYLGACISSTMATENNAKLLLDVPSGIYLIRANDKAVKIMVVR